jgi:hypothetical protein
MYTERLFNRDVVNEFTDVASAARGATLPEQRPRPCGTFWSLPADYWVNMQAQHDLVTARYQERA